jgi:hypothetical protein
MQMTERGARGSIEHVARRTVAVLLIAQLGEARRTAGRSSGARRVVCDASRASGEVDCTAARHRSTISIAGAKAFRVSPDIEALRSTASTAIGLLVPAMTAECIASAWSAEARACCPGARTQDEDTCAKP